MVDDKKSRNDDYLGYGVYADTLWARVETALYKDGFGEDGKSTIGEDPLVVGIFGEWGAGKSRLLKLILEKAEALEVKRIEARNATQDAGYGLTVPVLFQPWKYEHEPHLLVPLLLHILAALKETIASAQTKREKRKEKIDAGWEKLKPALDDALDGVEDLHTSVLVALEIVQPGAGVAFSAIKILRKWFPKSKPLRNLHKNFKYADDGRHYYEIHEHLKHVTRPKKYANELGGNYLSQNIKVNFVIFIDDLDRCLPEKAVETLELIKTVFNLESFAFVLALDEEVVERGIGHRYKDYALAGKKPEMPITGFEYLEKIVHLPFRLPALTKEQAILFVRTYEKSIEDDEHMRWFDPPSKKTDTAGTEKHGISREASTLDLLDLAFTGFHGFVPRKLIRMVELMHQTAAVAAARGKPLSRNSGGKSDTRVVLVFLLIQLFQPELYRNLRRKLEGFLILLVAFSEQEGNEITAADGTKSKATIPPAFRKGLVSDSDLLSWVVEGSSKRTHALRSNNLRGLRPDLTARIESIRDSEARALAQQVRLPLVTHLIEFRAAQRHVFDALKLLHALAGELGSQVFNINALDYFSLLGKDIPVEIVAGSGETVTTVLSTSPQSLLKVDARPRQMVRDLDQLFSHWQSKSQAVQATLAANNGLLAGHVLDVDSAAGLEKIAKDSISVAVGDTDARYRLLRGLQYLAPYISREDSPKFWELVKDTFSDAERDFSKEITDLAMLKRRELWADVRSTLGADVRFDGETLWASKEDKDAKKPGVALWLPKEKYKGNSDENEPIPGFVRVKSGKFWMGAKSENDNPRREFDLTNDFLIALNLTTVDQFAAFVDDGGYTEKWFLDEEGKRWLSGKNPEKMPPEYKARLERRLEELRRAPMQWAEQRAHGSRAVWGVNWFEARAYARWLNSKMADEIALKIPAAQDGGVFGIHLPTEAQWERAARASSFESADDREYFWNDNAKSAHLQANIDKSEIGRASVVGLFPPNALGASDLAGNLWEWQANLYDKDGVNVATPTGRDRDWKGSDYPALRGGSWVNNSDYARASFRSRPRPDDWGNNTGFRVVMSLAKNER